MTKEGQPLRIGGTSGLVDVIAPYPTLPNRRETPFLRSWAFTHTIFALHYAHDFYHESGGKGGGLAFPGGEEPDYWDFVYFSFVIGMTSQVSDVAIVSKPMRRTAAAHGIVSFVFNAALLAR